MPTYIPIETGVHLQASLSDMIALQWKNDGIVADFVLPGDNAHALRVSFDRPCIIRLVDEMPLSTEKDDSPNIGLISEHFAYRVEGAAFARMQSPAWTLAVGPVVNFRFITGWTCLDVVTGARPNFAVVDRA
jgi:hypothetical protein